MLPWDDAGHDFAYLPLTCTAFARSFAPVALQAIAIMCSSDADTDCPPLSIF